MTSPRVLSVPLPTLALLLLLAACGCEERRPAPLPLSLGVVNVPAYALIFVAEDEGLFVDAGVALRLETFATGRDCLPRLMSGEIDLATVYTPPVVLARLEGADIVAVTALHRSERTTAVLAALDSGIARVEDLRGRRVGMTPRTSSEFFLNLLLAEHGISRAELEVVEGGQAELGSKVLSGEVAAASLWSPTLVLTSRSQGGGGVRLESATYEEGSLLAGIRPRIDEKSEAVRRALLALAEAQRRIEANPALAGKSLARRLPELRPDEIEQIVKRSRFELGLSHRLRSVLRQEAGWLEEGGVARAPGVRVPDVLYTAPLRHAVPDAVTLPEVGPTAAPR